MSQDMMDNLQSTDVGRQREGAFQAAEAGHEEAVPLLVGLLQSDNLGVQEAADHALRKIGGRAAVAGVLPLLRSDEPLIRNLGMDLLRALGREHLDLLLPLLQDEDSDVRIFMSDILGSTDSFLAVPPLCQALLHDPEVNVRYQAAVSLGNLAHSEAAESLNQALGDDEWVQFAVVEALMKIGDDSSIGVLAQALGRSSDLVESMIVDALGEMGNFKAAPMLIKRLDNSDFALRNKVLRALVRILGGKSLSLLPLPEQQKIGRYLLVALDDEDVDVQDAALLGLGYVGDSEAAVKILELAGDLDPDQDLDRRALSVDSLSRIGALCALETALVGRHEGREEVAAQALERIASPEATALLMRAFPNKARDTQRVLAASLARIGGPEARDFFMDLLDTATDGTVLKQALYFLGTKLRCPECVEPILRFLGHPYNDVKETALEAAIAVGTEAVTRHFQGLGSSMSVLERCMGLYGLGKISASAHVQHLLRGLGDHEPDVRKVCLEALGSLTHNAEVFEALLALAADEVPEIRLALIEVLQRVCSGDAQDFLLRFLEDEDAWVRVRAVEALAECKFAQHVPAIIALLEDPSQLVVLKVLEALGHIGGQAAFRVLLEALNSEDAQVQVAAEQALDMLQAQAEGVC